MRNTNMYKSLILALVLFLPACGTATAPDAAPATDAVPVDAALADATTPDGSGSNTKCTASPLGDRPCWPYQGFRLIGDSTCLHEWHFDPAPGCYESSGWDISNDIFSTPNEGAILRIPKPVGIEWGALRVVISGDAAYFDRSLCLPEQRCAALPRDPDECFCELRKSEVQASIESAPGATLGSALSLADGSAVDLLLSCCYPDADWASVLFETRGNGGGSREVRDLRVQTKTQY